MPMGFTKSILAQIGRLPIAVFFVSCLLVGCSSSDDDRTPTEQSASTEDQNINLAEETTPINGTTELDQCACAENVQVAGQSAGCLEVVNHENVRFCYTELTRRLSAYQPDESLWWSFELPGSNESNKVEHLLVTGDSLVLVANVAPQDIEQSVFEITSFEFGGEFVSTGREIMLPVDEVSGSVQAVAAHSYTYLIADCFDANGQGTYVSRHRILRNDAGPPPHDRLDPLVTQSVCLSGMVRDGSPSFEYPDKIVLSVNGEALKLDLYTLKPAIAFDGQDYSLERRVEIRDQLLAVLSEPETAYPGIAHRVGDRVRILQPDESQCVDGGVRYRANWLSQWHGRSFDYIDCRTGSLLVESGRSMLEWPRFSEGVLAVNTTHIETQYVVSDSTSNEEWLISTNSTSSPGDEPIRDRNLEFNVEFLNYASPHSSLSIAPSRFTISEGQQNWIGSFSREHFSSGITETVDVDITLFTDDAGQIQMSGSLFAMKVGETTQMFRIDMLPNSNELIKYTVIIDDESMSVTEPW